MHYLDYNEKIRHGTDEFPMAYYGLTDKHPRYHMSAHWHREAEFVRVKKGAFLLYLEDRSMRLEAGDLALIGEAVIHSGEPEPGCEYECLVLDLKQLLQSTEPGKRAARSLLAMNAVSAAKDRAHSLDEAIESMFLLAAQLPGREIAVLGALYSVLDGILSEGGAQRLEPVRGRQRTEQLKPAIEYIEANYTRHIALEELARLAGLSPKYFCRYFQTIVHRTPIDYLNYFRIECACTALTATELSVAEIAYNCGFGDSSFFIKQFRRYKGVTPKQYRRQGYEKSPIAIRDGNML